MIDLLIDSGAYSVLTRGVEIKLDDYIAFLQDHRSILPHYVSLDVIPGRNGRRFADPKAAQLGYRNHQKMKEAGLTPMPVLHRQDELRWLETYLHDGEQQIALAPLPMQRNEVIAWLRRCFAILPASVKVHGLGLAVAEMLGYFRFASVDSSSWITKYGHIPVPVYNRGYPDYQFRPHSVGVTERSSLRADHFDNLDRLRQEQTESYLEECGTSLLEVRDSKPARFWVSIKFYQGLAQRTDTKLYFVSGPDRVTRQALLHCGARSHLLSYADLKSKRPGALLDYCQGVSPS